MSSATTTTTESDVPTTQGLGDSDPSVASTRERCPVPSKYAQPTKSAMWKPGQPRRLLTAKSVVGSEVSTQIGESTKPQENSDKLEPWFAQDDRHHGEVTQFYRGLFGDIRDARISSDFFYPDNFDDDTIAGIESIMNPTLRSTVHKAYMSAYQSAVTKAAEEADATLAAPVDGKRVHSSEDGKSAVESAIHDDAGSPARSLSGTPVEVTMGEEGIDDESEPPALDQDDDELSDNDDDEEYWDRPISTSYQLNGSLATSEVKSSKGGETLQSAEEAGTHLTSGDESKTRSKYLIGNDDERVITIMA